MVTGEGLRARVLAVVALVTGLVGYLVQSWLSSRSGGLPTPLWFSVAVLLASVVGVIGAAWPIGRALRGPNRRPVQARRAVRTLIFAQAEALTGAIVVGWYAAQAAVLAPDAGYGSVRSKLVVAGALVLCGVAMIAAGLWAQAQCRYDRDDRDDAADLDGRGR